MPITGSDDRRYRRLLAALCFISVIGPLTTFLYLPALPEVARLFNTTEAGAQGTLTSFLIGNCLGFALLGRLNDRFGQRRSYVSVMALFIFASLMVAVSPSLTWLVVARFFQGIGASIGVITARSIVRRTFPNGGSGGMAVLSAMGGLAPAASPVIGAIVLLVADWRMTFVSVAVLGAMSLLLSLKLFPKGAHLPAPVGKAGSALRKVLAHPETRAGFLLGSLHNGTFMVMMAGSPFIFVETFGWSQLSYSLLFGVILSSFAVMSIISGRAFPRHGIRRIMKFGLPGMVLGALATMGGAAANVDWMIALGLFVMICSMGPIVPGNHVRMLDPYPEMTGSVVGLSMLAVTLSGVVMIWLYGLFSEGSVLGYGLWIGIVTLLAVGTWLLYPPPADVGRETSLVAA
ncbi:MFS transporter [Devosia sp. YIM 151766]|uniref:MFS transporter n=1 Tax=Devosia sp. YIM 151766 TaxID=3017325 RepID=UPI00255C68CB|nr:MFS transporter [Devosia sp. YIM 151766]WIY52710.1 MFS transporter [Devosia sp. YIM 151766]